MFQTFGVVVTGIAVVVAVAAWRRRLTVATA
jgi:hypothetical protein